MHHFAGGWGGASANGWFCSPHGGLSVRTVTVVSSSSTAHVLYEPSIELNSHDPDFDLDMASTIMAYPDGCWHELTL